MTFALEDYQTKLSCFEEILMWTMTAKYLLAMYQSVSDTCSEVRCSRISVSLTYYATEIVLMRCISSTPDVMKEQDKITQLNWTSSVLITMMIRGAVMRLLQHFLPGIHWMLVGTSMEVVPWNVRMLSSNFDQLQDAVIIRNYRFTNSCKEHI